MKDVVSKIRCNTYCPTR